MARRAGRVRQHRAGGGAREAGRARCALAGRGQRRPVAVRAGGARELVGHLHRPRAGIRRARGDARGMKDNGRRALHDRHKTTNTTTVVLQEPHNTVPECLEGSSSQRDTPRGSLSRRRSSTTAGTWHTPPYRCCSGTCRTRTSGGCLTPWGSCCQGGTAATAATCCWGSNTPRCTWPAPRWRCSGRRSPRDTAGSPIPRCCRLPRSTSQAHTALALPFLQRMR